ncbi:MAG: RNA methyltransferase [Clostridia bacterium]|nr:RNA methyltransferase [Clostridia bacterium]
MNNIVSKSNDKVKFIKNLNEKKFRQKHNAFYLEGIKVVDEVLDLYEKKAVNIKFIACSYDILINLKRGNNIYERINKLYLEKRLEVYDFKREIFEYTTDTVTTQGVLVVLEIPNINFEKLMNNNDSNILILDKIKDQGNLGTIIRTCDAFKVKTIICTAGTADVYSQKTLRSTMGSILRVNIVYIDNYNIDDTFYLIKEKGYKIFGLALQTNKYVEYTEMNLKKICMIVGNEANGISDEILSKCDEILKIRMEDTAESLNVSVATSIILYKQYIDNIK